jgi:hypothetical protein
MVVVMHCAVGQVRAGSERHTAQAWSQGHSQMGAMVHLASCPWSVSVKVAKLLMCFGIAARISRPCVNWVFVNAAVHLQAARTTRGLVRAGCKFTFGVTDMLLHSP